jgi:hypothetical protein
MPDAFPKLPGMGIALTSEFLRNLKWDGFKVDRHIKRLFGRWFPEIATVDEKRMEQLLSIIGRSNRDLRDFLRFSLIGVAATPESTLLSEVDNFVWLLAAYVEKKDKESSIVYVH